jgi:hypothetical protein
VMADEDTRKRFFAKLMRCHTKVMNNAAGASANAARAASAAPVASPVAATHAITPVTATPAAAAGEAHADNAPLPVLTDAVLAPVPSLDFSELGAADASTPLAATPVPVDEDTEPAAAPPEFAAVTIQNPFGEGEIEVEEISMSDLPPGGAAAGHGESSGGDEHSRLVKGLKEGAWVEFRDEDDNRRPARLSYISPLKGTYLFVNRQGKQVGEYSLYQLSREFRTGRAGVLDAVPLFDRAMGSLVGVLRASTNPL